MIPARMGEAKKQYIGCMVAKMRGPSDEASIQAAVRKPQKPTPNKHNLEAQLRERLTAFVNEAKSVDFGAQTRPLAGRLVFTNPEYESKRGSWKLLYRMGRKAVTAAAEVAQEWTRE